MKQYSDLNNSTLIDMLAKHTALYTQLLADNIKTDEFYKCKRLVELLTAEFELRRRTNSPGHSTASTTAPLSEE